MKSSHQSAILSVRQAAQRSNTINRALPGRFSDSNGGQEDLGKLRFAPTEVVTQEDRRARIISIINDVLNEIESYDLFSECTE
jgi:hypothetical protein